MAERPHQPATNILRRRWRFIFRYGLSFSGESHFFLLFRYLVGGCGASFCHEKAPNDFPVKCSPPVSKQKEGKDLIKNL